MMAKIPIFRSGVYFFIFSIISIISLNNVKGQSYDYTQYVDPFIGTTGLGNTFPGPSLPFGMVKLGPDNLKKAENKGYAKAGEIDGFSHLHVSGTGGAPK